MELELSMAGTLRGILGSHRPQQQLQIKAKSILCKRHIGYCHLAAFSDCLVTVFPNANTQLNPITLVLTADTVATTAVFCCDFRLRTFESELGKQAALKNS